MLSKEDLIRKRNALTQQMLQIQGAIHFISQEITKMEEEDGEREGN